MVRSTKLTLQGEISNIPGNYYNKHETHSPIARFLMDRFHNSLLDQVLSVRPQSVLDVGCGEGHTTYRIAGVAHVPVVAVDLELLALSKARDRYPDLIRACGSTYRLPFRTNTFELVVATEMLEHLDAPLDALRELHRVGRQWCLLSVPHEPWWRVGNMARGAYWRELGNTPGHVQHWTRHGIRTILEGVFSQVEIQSAGLWNIALCRI